MKFVLVRNGRLQARLENRIILAAVQLRSAGIITHILQNIKPNFDGSGGHARFSCKTRQFTKIEIKQAFTGLKLPLPGPNGGFCALAGPRTAFPDRNGGIIMDSGLRKANTGPDIQLSWRIRNQPRIKRRGAVLTGLLLLFLRLCL